MSQEKLWAVAIYAFKPDPEQTVKRTDFGIQLSSESRGGVVELNSTPGVTPGVELAASKELAEEGALIQAKRLYPEDDGWILHAAYALEIDAEAILIAAGRIEADMQPANDETEREM